MLYSTPHAISDKFVVLHRYVDSAEWWVNGDNWECSVLFFVMYFQYITCALAYALGSTFRLSLLYNWAVVVSQPASPLLLLPLFVTHCAVLHLPSCSCTSPPKVVQVPQKPCCKEVSGIVPVSLNLS